MSDLKRGVCAIKTGGMIGKGSHAQLYKSKAKILGEEETVALKEIGVHPQKEESAAEAQQSILSDMLDEAEADIISMEPHKNLASYYGIEYTSGKMVADIDRLMITHQYVCEGHKYKTPMPEKEVQNVIKQVTSAIKHLHDKGISHDDLRPANVIHAPSTPELPIVTDWYFFKKVHLLMDPVGGAATTKQKPQYTAPEVFTDGNSYDQFAVDVWGIGCVTLELLSGKTPFQELDPSGRGNVMFKIVQSNAPPKYPDGLSDDCKSFLNACFDRDYINKRPNIDALSTHAWIV